jgi:hypothetical protein
MEARWRVVKTQPNQVLCTTDREPLHRPAGPPSGAAQHGSALLLPPSENDCAVVAPKAKRVGQRDVELHVDRLLAHEHVQVDLVFGVVEVEVGVYALPNERHDGRNALDTRRAREQVADHRLRAVDLDPARHAAP